MVVGDNTSKCNYHYNDGIDWKKSTHTNFSSTTFNRHQQRHEIQRTELGSPSIIVTMYSTSQQESWLYVISHTQEEKKNMKKNE